MKLIAFLVMLAGMVPIRAGAGTAYTPPASGSSVASPGAADWADPYYETAGDGLTEVDAADWLSAHTYGGGSEVCRQAVHSRYLRLRASLKADCSTSWASTDRAMGMLHAVPAGDFIVAFRFGIHREQGIGAGGGTLDAGPVFVDGDDTGADSWYGSMLYGSTIDGAYIYQVTNTAGADRFSTYGSYANLNVYVTWQTVYDVVFQRSGTALTMYQGAPMSPLPKVASWTVSADAGLVGVRSQTFLSTADEMDVVVYAFRSLSEVPW